jgi:O-antigen ligase
LIACVVSFLLIQIFIHGESILDSNIRAFITWILGLIIVHSLCLRQGFSYRLPIVLFATGAVTIPYLGFDSGGVEMARVDLAVQGGLTHPGGLAQWFGFLAIFFAITGIETRRGSVRIGAWLIAVGCLCIVGLTVERGPLFATVLGITVASRRLLKRGFAPVFVLVALTGVVSVTGLFDQAISRYLIRGTEETGREILWPAVVERIIDSPLIGVGISQVGTEVLRPHEATPPHNSFLYFALSSGIVPIFRGVLDTGRSEVFS